MDKEAGTRVENTSDFDKAVRELGYPVMVIRIRDCERVLVRSVQEMPTARELFAGRATPVFVRKHAP